jgi:hypothetical protein
MGPAGPFLGRAIEVTEFEAVDAAKVEAADFPSELTVRLAGVSWQLVPLGVPAQLHDSEMVPIKEFSGSTLTVKLAELPAASVEPPGLMLKLKSGTPSTTCVRGFEVRGLNLLSPL